MNTCTHTNIQLSADLDKEGANDFKAGVESSLLTIQTTPAKADEIFFRIDALLRDLRLCFLQLNMAVQNVASAANKVQQNLSTEQQQIFRERDIHD